MIKLLVFDFDGTLVDSRDIIYDSIRGEVEKYGVHLGAKYKRDMGLHKLKIDLEVLKLPFHIPTIVKNINREIARNSNRFGLQEGYSSLKKIKKKKIILSNNVKKSIKAFLKFKKEKQFSRVFDYGDFFDKKDGLEKIFRKYHLKPEEVIFVGDRASDVESGIEAGCFVVGIYNKISWGTKKEILGAKPDYIISDLRELGRIVKELDSF